MKEDQELAKLIKSCFDSKVLVRQKVYRGVLQWYEEKLDRIKSQAEEIAKKRSIIDKPDVLVLSLDDIYKLTNDENSKSV